jgi:hypothetical protein
MLLKREKDVNASIEYFVAVNPRLKNALAPGRGYDRLATVRGPTVRSSGFVRAAAVGKKKM